MQPLLPNQLSFFNLARPAHHLHLAHTKRLVHLQLALKINEPVPFRSLIFPLHHLQPLKLYKLFQILCNLIVAPFEWQVVNHELVSMLHLLRFHWLNYQLTRWCFQCLLIRGNVFELDVSEPFRLACFGVTNQSDLFNFAIE